MYCSVLLFVTRHHRKSVEKYMDFRVCVRTTCGLPGLRTHNVAMMVLVCTEPETKSDCINQ